MYRLVSSRSLRSRSLAVAVVQSPLCCVVSSLGALCPFLFLKGHFFERLFLRGVISSDVWPPRPWSRRPRLADGPGSGGLVGASPRAWLCPWPGLLRLSRRVPGLSALVPPGRPGTFLPRPLPVRGGQRVRLPPGGPPRCCAPRPLWSGGPSPAVAPLARCLSRWSRPRCRAPACPCRPVAPSSFFNCRLSQRYCGHRHQV